LHELAEGDDGEAQSFGLGEAGEAHLTETKSARLLARTRIALAHRRDRKTTAITITCASA
jgi:hypothetical protein